MEPTQSLPSPLEEAHEVSPLPLTKQTYHLLQTFDLSPLQNRHMYLTSRTDPYVKIHEIDRTPGQHSAVGNFDRCF